MMNMTMQMMEMHMKDMPMQGMDMMLMQECIEACSACEQASTMCADSMMGDGMAMARSMCANMADMAGTMMRAMLRPNGMHMECMKHAGMSEDARMCAEACRQCAMCCQKMMDAMKGMMPTS